MALDTNLEKDLKGKDCKNVGDMLIRQLKESLYVITEMTMKFSPLKNKN